MNNDKLIKNLIRLDGKTALVSGGAGHLGRAISETLAELGSDIVIIGQNGSDGKIFAEELIQKFNVNVEFRSSNLNSKDSIDNLMDSLDTRFDILVNNAFTWPSTLNFEDTNWDDFESTLTSGITSPFYLSKLVIKKMKKFNQGNIINIGSMYGMVSPNFKIYKNQPKMGNALAYNASKAAIIQMTKYLAVSCSKYNIRVNCVNPGPFPRPGTFKNGKEWFESELKEMNPLKKLGEPWHLKGVIALLASDLSDYMTGQNISVDGGWTIW